MVCEHPRQIHWEPPRLGGQQLHCSHGPAIVWAEGWDPCAKPSRVGRTRKLPRIMLERYG
jgi:hypothetical protein